MRDDHLDWNRDRDRELDDRSEGNRWGDHPRHDRELQMQRDRYATGQSGYSAGRSGEDPSLDYQNRNSGYSRGANDDQQVFGTDDRFTGRSGAEDYTRGRGMHGGSSAQGRRWDAERTGQRDSYGDRNYDQSFGNRDDRSMGRGIYDHRGDDRSFQSRDYGPSESERGAWSTNIQGQGQGQGQGPHRGKGPRGYTRSDERIRETVCEALTEDAHIDASGIDVEVKNGEVVLSGMVPDRQTKRAAEDLVEGLSGVTDVTNQLKVGGDERQKLGRAGAGQTSSTASSGNPTSNGLVSHDESRKDDKKARA